MMRYNSVVEVESRAMPGVRLTVRKMSFGRRLELAQEVRELADKIDFFQAGDTPKEKMTATVLSRELDLVYLRWGLAAVQGLELDGSPATPDSLVREGPEELVEEALQAIRRECGLSEEERKN
jgi:hypothetical protein